MWTGSSSSDRTEKMDEQDEMEKLSAAKQEQNGHSSLR